MVNVGYFCALKREIEAGSPAYLATFHDRSPSKIILGFGIYLLHVLSDGYNMG